MRKWKIVAAAAALCSGLVGQVSADGVHFWVDLNSQLVGDATGKLIGLRMGWLFDKPSSEALLEGENLGTTHLPATLKTVAARIINDLHGRSYFTRLNIDTTSLRVGTVTDYQLSLGQDRRLKLDFLLPLAKPQLLSGKKLNIEVADPSGTTVFLHPSIQAISTGTRWADCAISLEAHRNLSAGQPAQTAHLQCR